MDIISTPTSPNPTIFQDLLLPDIESCLLDLVENTDLFDIICQLDDDVLESPSDTTIKNILDYGKC
ncbi:MAG: hypothetical protein LC105_11590 [Chitinophagales bacterium]|nr:hypothetical protein [Chitinophagales bacterium]MCZ2394491.1 hypothetical protein [Chitinophagales bacterium]